MNNPIQLLRDFLKWRKERYRGTIRQVAKTIAELEYCGDVCQQCYAEGIVYGVTHRKEILKKVKI